MSKDGELLNFKERVLEIVKTVPRGKTITYKEVAELAGSPNAYRAVGNIMSKNYNIRVPCHRVIRSDSDVGGFNQGKQNKVELLMRERC